MIFSNMTCLIVGSSAPQLNFTLIGVALELSFMDFYFFIL